MKPSSSVKDCPQCGLVNPSTATLCDCGYEFASGRATRPYQNPEDSVLTPVDVAVCVLLPAIGLIAGIVRMFLGKPSGKLMTGLSFVMCVLFTVLGFMFLTPN